MNNSDLIRALKGVPELRPRLIALAWELTGGDGNLDMDKLTFRIKEVKEAADEAEDYSTATRKAVQCLITMGHS